MSAEVPGVGRGHGKLILFGEHAVVYGVPALAAGLSRGALATVRPAVGVHSTLSLLDGRLGTSWPAVVADEAGAGLSRALWALLHETGTTLAVDVSVTLDVPVGAGMGSSAALAVAVASALGADAATIERAVAASEGVFHGNPSGIDQTAARLGGVFRFVRGTPAQVTPVAMPTVEMVVVVAGPPASTARMVEGVRGRRERLGGAMASVFEAIGQVVSDAEQALGAGDWSRVGELMDFNQGLLNALGVSTPEIERACGLLREAGALGAKLTGAGGGGCVIGLAPQGADAVCARLEAEGFEAFVVTIA